MISRRASLVQLSPSMQALLAFGKQRGLQKVVLFRGRESFVLSDREAANLQQAMNTPDSTEEEQS